MKVLKEELKYLLRNPFLYVIMVLGIAWCMWTASTGVQLETISMTNRYVDWYGTSFNSEKDVEWFQKFILEETEKGKTYTAMAKKYGLPDDPGEMWSFIEENFPEGEIVPEYVDEAYILGFELENLLHMPEIFLEVQKASSKKNKEGLKRAEESMIQQGTPEWERELVLAESEKAYDTRFRQIQENKENQYLTPIDGQFLIRIGSSFSMIWFFGILAAFVTAFCGIAKCFSGNRRGILFSCQKGRALLWYKVLAVMLITAIFTLVLSVLVVGGYWLVYLGLYRYWNLPTAAFLQDGSSFELLRISIDFGGYLLFLIGVGIAIAVVLALLFCGVMTAAKRARTGAGAAMLAAGVLAGISMMSGIHTLFLASTPIAIMINGHGLLRVLSNNEFTALPHFEGLSLLAWALLFSGLFTMMAIRFRKVSL